MASTKPLELLFVCYGNYCRSPIAEFVMRDKVQRAGLAARIRVRSGATSSEDVGSRPHPESRRLLREHGLSCGDKRAYQMTRDDLARADFVLIMDERNARAMRERFGSFGQEKIHKLSEFAGLDGDIADPWITHDFETAYAEIERGCEGLLARLLDEGLGE